MTEHCAGEIVDQRTRQRSACTNKPSDGDRCGIHSLAGQERREAKQEAARQERVAAIGKTPSPFIKRQSQRLSAAREGVVKALEGMMAALNKRNEGIPTRSFAESDAYGAASAALDELREANE